MGYSGIFFDWKEDEPDGGQEEPEVTRVSEQVLLLP
jgi:hypothetical protein